VPAIVISFFKAISLVFIVDSSAWVYGLRAIERRRKPGKSQRLTGQA